MITMITMIMVKSNGFFLRNYSVTDFEDISELQSAQESLCWLF